MAKKKTEWYKQDVAELLSDFANGNEDRAKKRLTIMPLNIKRHIPTVQERREAFRNYRWAKRIVLKRG